MNMLRNHFFLDTSFLINHPDFNEYLFDTKPYVLVICEAVVHELDGLKKSKDGSTFDEMSRSYKAREVSRRIEAIKEQKIQLVNDGDLHLYTRRVTKPGYSFDEEIEETAKRYANELKVNKKAVYFLSSDRNLRILARGTGPLIVVDPDKWEATKFQEQDYERRVEQAAQIDEQVASVYKERLSFEYKRYSTHRRDIIESIDELTVSLTKAQEEEHRQLERFEEEQRVLKAEKDRQHRLANRNKYTLDLSDLRYSSIPKTFPVYQEDWTQIGEIIVQKYFKYVHYQDRIITLHLSAQIAGRTFPLVVISAAGQPLYQIDRPAYFIDPVEHKKVGFQDGDWKIIMTVDELKVAQAPITLPSGAIGQFPVFETLSFRIEAIELTADEIAEARWRKAERETKDGWKEMKEWLLIVGAILAGILILLAPFLCLLLLAVFSRQ